MFLPSNPHYRPGADGSHALSREQTPAASNEPPLLIPAVVDLRHPQARYPELVGSKAASLAAAAAAGLPVLPGFALTTAGASNVFRTSPLPSNVLPQLHRAWKDVSDEGTIPLVVRSSSTVEDSETSSMAGRFTSVLDVRGWSAFIEAVLDVIDSANQPDLSDAPMAVLVQPFLRATTGGVLFGADPVTGNADHLVVAGTDQGPNALVSGQVDGTTSLLDRRGATIKGPRLPRRLRRRLVRVARDAEEAFGGPQDIEWATDATGKLWLLQSRPITTPLDHPTGHRFGPGPLAETFPAPLTTLEDDLWVIPVRDALRHSLTLTGAASAKAIRESPLVVNIDGRVAADLDLLVGPTRRNILHRLDPRPPLRRLRVAWRVGQLRSALPALANDLIGDIDTHLLAVNAPSELATSQLVAVLRNSRQALTALHGYEMLAGSLLPASEVSVTGASTAMRALAEGRADGLDDDQIIQRDPVVLVLTPPSITRAATLPAQAAHPHANTNGAAPVPATRPGHLEFAMVAREALRIRVRWVQELTAHVTRELARRWTDAGRLPDPEAIGWMRFAEVQAMAAGGASPTDLSERHGTRSDAELPASFRVGRAGAVIADAADTDTAVGAGGGRGRGPVHTGRSPSPGDVLVVRTLDPDLATLLPRLGGLVAETGSPLSHLAILAREYAVPTVVGFAGARERFQAGQLVDVDGSSGTVAPVDDASEVAVTVTEITSTHSKREVT